MSPLILSPDDLGPTVCIGEILVEIVATTVGNGFLSPQPLIGPYPSGAPAIFIDQCGKMGGRAKETNVELHGARPSAFLRGVQGGSRAPAA